MNDDKSVWGAQCEECRIYNSLLSAQLKYLCLMSRQFKILDYPSKEEVSKVWTFDILITINILVFWGSGTSSPYFRARQSLFDSMEVDSEVKAAAVLVPGSPTSQALKVTSAGGSEWTDDDVSNTRHIQTYSHILTHAYTQLNKHKTRPESEPEHMSERCFFCFLFFLSVMMPSTLDPLHNISK